jgi:CheY-like chemotaxis protein
MPYILVVDDDPDLANASAKVLSSEGYEVKVSLDTDDAMQLIEKRRPDLVLLDVMFPGNSAGGFDLARKIAESVKTGKKIPVLMLTAVNQHFPLGFSDKDIDPEWLPVVEFMEKPVEFGLLKSKVRQILSKSSA